MQQHRHNSTFQRKSGFTLVELLAVIAIVAVLFAILFPVISSVRKSAAEVESVSTIRNFGNCAFLTKAETGYLATHRRYIGWFGTYMFYHEYFLTEYLDYNMDAVRSPIDNWDEQTTYVWRVPIAEKTRSDEIGKISYGRNSYYPLVRILVEAPAGTSSASPSVKANYYPPNEAQILYPDQTLYFIESRFSAVNPPGAKKNINFFYKDETASPAYYFDGHVDFVTRAELLGEADQSPTWDKERINIFWYGNPEGSKLQPTD